MPYIEIYESETSYDNKGRNIITLTTLCRNTINTNIMEEISDIIESYDIPSDSMYSANNVPYSDYKRKLFEIRGNVLEEIQKEFPKEIKLDGIISNEKSYKIEIEE